MAQDAYPELDFGRETGVPPSRFRVSGRKTTVVGAVIDGDAAAFDNGILAGKAKVEEGIKFGPEVLRALGGRRVIALWLAAVNDDQGRAGWYGMTVGEMRIDRVKGEGFRDVAAFQSKLADAAAGRTAVWQLKEEERGHLVKLLATQPSLWMHAAKSFRDTLSSTIPELKDLEVAAAKSGEAAPASGPPLLALGREGGFEPRTLRTAGRDLSILGVLVDGASAAWDNGVLEGKSRVEAGVTFGPEVLRAMGGKRFCAVWVAVARGEDGAPGYFGATVCDMRIDVMKKDGFRDVGAHSMKLNDAARGKPEEKKALGDLLKGQPELWANAVENLQNAFG
ncbi:MAG: YwhD family protein [Planctomycetaceae bacterium]|nr:YwhD family protein [Planctomycetaceae bacterium]